MHRRLIAAVAALGLSAPALAAPGNNYVDGYLVLSEIDVGPFDEDGSGFGLKGEFQIHEKLFLNGEYQTVDYDEDVDQLRLGASFGPGAGSRAEGLYGRVEYVNFDFGSGSGSEQDGIGGHVGYGLPLSKELRLHGEAGYLVLDDLDGPELLVGATYQIAPNIALFGDYRASFLEVDNGGGDVDVNDLRLGARFLF